MIGDEPWRLAARELSDDDLKALIRGLILFSQCTAWNGGSVSPVIPLYREYLSRQPADEPLLTAWIVDHRRNEYEPFGTMIHGGSRTVAELHQHQAARRKQAAEGSARDAERQRAHAQAKADRATTRIHSAVRRGDVAALRGLLQAGGDIRRVFPDDQSAIEFARANGRPSMVAFLSGLNETGKGPSLDAPTD